jgi:RHS repeat-associated protein
MGTVRYTVVNGQVIAENRNGVRKTYVPDPSGSTIALLDDKQKITDTFSYSPFGELKSRTGTTPTPFQYIGTRGYYTDPNNRVYVRARTYQPNYARWMTVDPLWPGESAYGYARNNPVRWVDPSGTGVLIVIGVIGGLLATPVIVGGLVGCSLASWSVGKETHEVCKKFLKHPECDKLAHCVSACIARKCGTIVLSWCLGLIKDNPFTGDPKDRAGDLAANHKGEQCALSGKELRVCLSCCLEKILDVKLGVVK